MTNPAVIFLNQSEFILEGRDAIDWRKSKRIWIEGAEFSPSFKKGFIDGYRYPGYMNSREQLVLRRGMVRRVVNETNAVIIKPPPMGPEIPLFLTPEEHEKLRDYQKESLQVIFGVKWGRIALATNAGKGAIIGIAAREAARYNVRSLILCDELSVFSALKQEITKWSGSEPDCVNSDPNHIPSGVIVLAMLPTIYARVRNFGPDVVNRSEKVQRRKAWKDWLKTFGMALCDEADKATATSWQFVLGEMENTNYRIGFSGTFFDEWTLDEMLLEESFGPVLVRVGNLELVTRGISARPLVELVPFDNGYLHLPPRREWKSLKGGARRALIYEQGVVLNERRHRLICSLLSPDDPNAIVVNYVDHGQLLSTVIPNSRFLHGEDPKDVREDVLEQFKRGEFQNLIVTKILDRGTNDLGKVVGLIFASGQGSLRQTLQRIGRGLRRADGKQFLFLRDIMDRGHAYFDNQTKKRLYLYNKEGFEIRIK